ncbi:MAG: sulfatase [Acidobacteriota bacterium]
MVPTRSPRQRRHAVLGWALTGALLAGLGCQQETAPPSGPSVLLISLDTFRADGLGALRRGPSITPELDRFAADSIVFRHAIAPMAFTLPSHMSMFTGLNPGAHGVSTEKDRLTAALVTLPEILQEAGYRTSGLVTNDWLKADFGFGRGFDSYSRLRHRLTYADRLNREALDKLPRDPERTPFFLFLHYMDPHSDFTQVANNQLPYYAPPEFRSAGPAGEGFCDPQGNCATQYLLQADRDQRPLPAAEIDAIRRQYEDGLRYLDAELGRLFQELRRRGLYERMLIVLTSDHGEEFREHGRFLHSQVYEETVAVPLVVKLPEGRLKGRQIPHVVRLIDLLPTITDLLGLASPPDLQGRSLVPLIENGDWDGLPALSQDKLRRSRFSLRTRRFKVIHDFQDGHTELFDLLEDPAELEDLSQARPGLTERLRDRLQQEVRDNRRRFNALPQDTGEEDSQLSPEERERLKSLGYL